jgi:hypothetical protein
MGDQTARSADTPSRHLRAVRGPVPALRKTVSLYFHDTERDERHRWTLEHLLAMVERHRPGPDGGPDRTFVIGGKREYVGISTSGPDHFTGQHPLWGEKGKFEGAMMFDDLTREEVRQILEKFYAGRRVEGCFAPYYGRFEFYRTDRPQAR